MPSTIVRTPRRGRRWPRREFMHSGKIHVHARFVSAAILRGILILGVSREKGPFGRIALSRALSSSRASGCLFAAVKPPCTATR